MNQTNIGEPKILQPDMKSHSSGSQEKKAKLKSKPLNHDNAAPDCDAHSPVIMFKRWKKIEEDFFVVKKKKAKHSPIGKQED